MFSFVKIRLYTFLTTPKIFGTFGSEAVRSFILNDLNILNRSSTNDCGHPTQICILLGVPYLAISVYDPIIFILLKKKSLERNYKSNQITPIHTFIPPVSKFYLNQGIYMNHFKKYCFILPKKVSSVCSQTGSYKVMWSLLVESI